MPAHWGYHVKEVVKQVLMLWRASIICLIVRYLQEFEEKIPRAEMLELQVFMFFFL